MMVNDDVFLTVKEAAALIRVVPGTIRKWLYTDETLRYSKAGGRVLIKKSDLLALIKTIEARSDAL